MKWFKHQSTARNDERISMLEDRTGLEGYGFYFKMLEIVAEVVDATDKHEVIYSLSRWGRQTNIASKKWLFLSQCCADVGLMIVCRLSDDGLTSDYRISVKIPNLLKYRDNHTRNLQVANKQEIEEEKEVEVELEEDKELDKEKPLTPIPVRKKRTGPKEETELQANCKKTWAAYSDAYFFRYGAYPVRNVTINSQVKSFVKRIGYEESPFVAEFFVSNNSLFYVQKGHQFGILLSDAEKVRTEWATGKSITSTRAKQIDQTQANFGVVAEAMKILEDKHNAKAS